MYLLLTDQLPFKLPADLAWESNRIFEEELTPPSEFNPDVNQSLDRIVSTCLKKIPQDRYASANELLTALESWNPKDESNRSPHGSSQSDFSKVALGDRPLSGDKEKARDMVRKAFALKDDGRLADAADALEEALNKSPDVREKYANQVKLWRCGISM